VKGLLPDPVVVSIKSELKITEDLDHEVDTAARTYGYYAVLAEKAETRHQKMRFAFETWQAEVESREAKARNFESKKAHTEAQMKAHVRSQPKYRSYQLKLIEFDEHRRILKIIAKAFELKKDLVQTKCSNRRGEARGKVGSS
jgi:isopenicillin N synthase-like dioxygenase